MQGRDEYPGLLGLLVMVTEAAPRLQRFQELEFCLRELPGVLDQAGMKFATVVISLSSQVRKAYMRLSANSF